MVGEVDGNASTTVGVAALLLTYYQVIDLT